MNMRRGRSRSSPLMRIWRCSFSALGSRSCCMRLSTVSAPLDALARHIILKNVQRRCLD